MDISEIGIVIADEKEFSPFLSFFRGSSLSEEQIGGFRSARFFIERSEVIVMLCGIGKVNSACAAATLIHACGCKIILNAGLSGGVKADIASFVVSKRFVEHDFDLTPIGYPLGKKPGEDIFSYPDEELLCIAEKLFSRFGIRRATFGSGDGFISSSEQTRRFIKEFDEDACDMESAAISSVCRRNCIPFISFRKISDGADESAVEDYNDMNDREEIDLAELIFEYVKELNKQ